MTEPMPNAEGTPMLTLSDVLAARGAIAPHIWRTPLLRSAALSARTGADIYLKLEFPCLSRSHVADVPRHHPVLVIVRTHSRLI